MSDELNFILHLPADVSTHILLKLPAKSLLICTCVCKSWSSFINSPSFFSSHINQNETNYSLLQLCSSRKEDRIKFKTDCFFLHSKDQDFNLLQELHFPYQVKFGFQVMASCNGLILLMHGQYRLILWNPLIRKMMVIGSEFRPELSPLEAIGLGFDSETRDYKILSITKERENESTLMVLLYSLNANSWKRLPDIEAVNHKYENINRGMVYLNGALYFVISRAWRMKAWDTRPMFVILGFDLSNEVFHEVMLPDCIASGSRFLYPASSTEHINVCTYRESLAVLWFDESTGDVKIWAKKERGVQVSWTLLSTFCMEWRSSNLEITGLMFIDDSRVILSIGSSYGYGAGSIFLHDLKSQETKEIEIVGEHNCVFLGDYVESLVLLDKGNELRRYIVDFMMKWEWKKFQAAAKREAQAQALRKVRDSASETVRNKDYTPVPMSNLASKIVPYGSSKTRLDLRRRDLGIKSLLALRKRELMVAFKY